jgi:3-methyl-2-oxobutanoate hydroxymethyltransferase
MNDKAQQIISLKNMRKISMLTAYDFSMAKLLDQTKLDIVLVGDSAGNVILGYNDTLPVKLNEMSILGKAVRRAVSRAMVVIDLPASAFKKTWRSWFSIDEAFLNANRLLKETKADGIKIEGNHQIGLIKKLVKAGIPVMGHLGYTPQLLKKPRIMGREVGEAEAILAATKELEAAGVFSIVLELVEPETAKEITKLTKVPTIGIGSGKDCDGQVLVTHDLVGLYGRPTPKFVKPQADLGSVLKNAVDRFIQEL